MPFPIAEVIGTAGAIGTTAANAAFTGKTNRKSRAFIEHQWLKQKDLDRENWQMQNEYNLPANQMKRLKDAGLNPALVYGNGATTTAANIDSHVAGSWNPEAPTLPEGAISGALGNIYKMRTNKIQENLLQQNLKNAKAEENSINAKTIESLSHAKSADQGTERSRFDLALDEELRAWTASERKSKTHQASTIVDKLLTETNLAKKDLANKDTMLRLQNAYTQMSTLEKAQAIKKMESEIQNQGMDFKIKAYEHKLNEAGTQKTDPWYFRMLMSILSDSSNLQK